MIIDLRMIKDVGICMARPSYASRSLHIFINYPGANTHVGDWHRVWCIGHHHRYRQVTKEEDVKRSQEQQLQRLLEVDLNRQTRKALEWHYFQT